MVLGMLFENFKNYYILRYVIYEFLKKVLGVPQPTCLVRVHCAMYDDILSYFMNIAHCGKGSGGSGSIS